MCNPTNKEFDKESKKVENNKSRRTRRFSLLTPSRTFRMDASAIPKLLWQCTQSLFDQAEATCSIMLAVTSNSANAPPEQIDNMVEQLSSTDRWGNSALHVACFHRPPLRLIQILLKLSDYWKLDLQKKCNDHGATPLYTACHSGASAPVIRALLASNTASSSETELSLVCRCDYRGSSPIDAIFWRYQVFQRLARLKKIQQQRRNKNYYLPTKDEQDSADNVKTTTERILSGMDPATFWTTLDTLLESAWITEKPEQDSSTRPFSRLAAAAYFCHLLPTELTDLLLLSRLNNHATTVESEITTLTHLAVSRPWNPQFLETTEASTRQIRFLLQTQQSYFLRRILVCSSVISRPTFVQAAASGLAWSIVVRNADTTNEHDDGSHNSSSSSGPLRILFEANPTDSLTSRDEVTGGLYPFQVAAAAASSPRSFRSRPDGQEEQELDTIYMLLRMAPETIQHTTTTLC